LLFRLYARLDEALGIIRKEIIYHCSFGYNIITGKSKSNDDRIQRVNRAMKFGHDDDKRSEESKEQARFADSI